ncbi:MAG: T9SS type A sorting domain-containing protein, partial [Ignavibacteria bacterium]
ITFIVLDTELDANSFSSTFIKGKQLQMVKDVCDSITESRYLILLHHRFMWMINNDYFKSRLTDSIAASSRSMDTTNFYSDIYPLLQKVKNKGIQVLVFGGDKSKINILYSPEDSITFYAARMATDIPDDINNVIVLNYNLLTKELTCSFVPLTEITTSAAQESTQLPKIFCLNQNYPNPFNPSTKIRFEIPENSLVHLTIFNVLGKQVAEIVKREFLPGVYSIEWNGSSFASGIYLLKMNAQSTSGRDYSSVKKLVLLK